MSYRFVSDEGDIKDGDDLVFPICHKPSKDEIRLIGTGFYINQYGIGVTSKHVLLDRRRDNHLNDIFVVRFLPENEYLFIPLTKAIVKDDADIALIKQRKVENDKTGETLTNKELELSLAEPNEDDYCATYAWPETTIQNLSPKTELHFESKFYEGKVKAFLPEGRDQVMLPSACYRTTMELKGRSSGGPVFGEDGKVFGVNCTGFQGENLSYIIPIEEIMDITITDLILPDGTHRDVISVSELADMDLISVER